ncbi:MAG: F0F1 ATP synthase subunit delta [Candidatus Omnitrophota bacterium]
MQAILVWPFVLLQIATVVAIVMFLRMVLHRQLEIGINRIKKMDKDNLEKEVKLNNRLEKFNKEYEEKMRIAEKQADDLLNLARESSKKIRDEERAKAKEEAKKIIANALREKESILKEAARELDRKASEFAEVILKRVFSEKELSGFRVSAVREIVDALVGTENIRELLEKHKQVKVLTTDKLSAQDEAYVIKAIEAHGGGGTEVEFTIDPSVLGGVLFKIGPSTIDGGIAARIRNAAMAVKEEI